LVAPTLEPRPDEDPARDEAAHQQEKPQQAGTREMEKRLT
jgi:hypothetical protein